MLLKLEVAYAYPSLFPRERPIIHNINQFRIEIQEDNRKKDKGRNEGLNLKETTSKEATAIPNTSKHKITKSHSELYTVQNRFLLLAALREILVQ